MSPLTRLTRRAALPAAAVVAVLATSACQPATAGAAAIVGSQRLSVAQLQHDVDTLLAEGGGQGQTGGLLQRNMVDRWIYSQLVDRAARAEGITVTPGAVAARVAQIKAQGGEQGYRQAVISSGAPFEDADDLVRMVVQLDALGRKLVPQDPSADPQVIAQKRQQVVDQLVTKQAENVTVEVNPRYGSFDRKTATVLRIQSGGLAVDQQTFQQMK